MDVPPVQELAASLDVTQPFKFTFYVNKFPADGILRLPDGLMGYYTRYFGKNPASSRPPVTIPFYINGFALTFDSICQWDVNDIILDYGILSPGDTRKISAPAGFTCNRDSRVKVWPDTTWGTEDETGVSVDLRDAEGTKTVGQSRVQITSNSVGGNGREVIVTAPTGVKQNFMVSSELDTRGMPAGVFQGSAVLIATLESPPQRGRNCSTEKHQTQRIHLVLHTTNQHHAHLLVMFFLVRPTAACFNARLNAITVTGSLLDLTLFEWL